MSVGIIVQGMAKDHDKVVETEFKRVAEENNFLFKRTEDGAEITMCNLGQIYVTLGKHGKIVIDSSTSMLGAGFHHAVCLFIEKLLPLMGNVVVQDETGYYADRDFKKLHEEHFIKYLRQILEEVTKNIDANALAEGTQYGMKLVHWNINNYIPKTINNCIATLYGRFSYKKLLNIKENNLVEEFAKEFYIWNEIEQDALFFRNAALNIMWEQLHYFESARYQQESLLNREVINLLEESVKLDKNIPFPNKEYLEICTLTNHTPIDLSSLQEYVSEYEIGYRKDMVSYRYGNMNIAIDGNLLFEEMEVPTWFSADDDWKNLEVSGFTTPDDKSMHEEVRNLVERLNSQSKLETISHDHMKAYIGFLGKKDDHHITLAIFAHNNQITLATYRYKSEYNNAWALECAKASKPILPKQQ